MLPAYQILALQNKSRITLHCHNRDKKGMFHCERPPDAAIQFAASVSDRQGPVHTIFEIDRVRHDWLLALLHVLRL